MTISKLNHLHYFMEGRKMQLILCFLVDDFEFTNRRNFLSKEGDVRLFLSTSISVSRMLVYVYTRVHRTRSVAACGTRQ